MLDLGTKQNASNSGSTISGQITVSSTIRCRSVMPDLRLSILINHSSEQLKCYIIASSIWVCDSDSLHCLGSGPMEDRSSLESKLPQVANSTWVWPSISCATVHMCWKTLHVLWNIKLKPLNLIFTLWSLILIKHSATPEVDLLCLPHSAKENISKGFKTFKTIRSIDSRRKKLESTEKSRPSKIPAARQQLNGLLHVWCLNWNFG